LVFIIIDNYSTLVSNDGMMMDSFQKTIPDNSMKNENNIMMNSTPKRTPIIKNKRHTRVIIIYINIYIL